MNRSRKAPDLVLFFAVIAMLTIGIIMVYSASSITSMEENNGNAFYYLSKQIMWVFIGFASMFITMNFNYYKTKKFILPFLILNLLLLIAVLIPGVGISVSGSNRWLGVGSFRVQPSEIAKIAAIFYTAKFLSTHQGRVGSFMKGVFPPLMVAGIFSVLILMQPDLGTAGAIGVTVVVMLFVAGIKVTHFIFLMTSGFAGVLALIFSEDYRRERLLAFLDPWKDPLDTGFQYIQSLLAVGSGGLVGVGLGRSRQKFYYLPEQHTDFIYAVICEELGFIGAATIILLYLLFAWRGYQIALKAPDVFGSLLAAGITTMIILQAVLNIGVVTAVLPITGITLPLISYGGSSLVITMASVGVLLNISRFTTRQ